MNNKLLIPIILLIPFLVNGCSKKPDANIITTGKVTGGGWMGSASEEPREKANFGFNMARCEVETPTIGHITFHDKSLGVKIKGQIDSILFCGDADVCHIDECPDDSYEAKISYKSTNPKMPGSGIAFACVTDNGEGVNAILPDEGIIEVETGPFQDYFNFGQVHGNIQFHTCTCTDGEDNNLNGLIDEEDPSCIDSETGLFDPNGDEE